MRLINTTQTSFFVPVDTIDYLNDLISSKESLYINRLPGAVVTTIFGHVEGP